MSYVCDRCGKQSEYFAVSYLRSRDDEPDQPDHPPEADQYGGHLCGACRVEFREWLEYTGS